MRRAFANAKTCLPQKEGQMDTLFDSSCHVVATCNIVKKLISANFYNFPELPNYMFS